MAVFVWPELTPYHLNHFTSFPAQPGRDIEASSLLLALLGLMLLAGLRGPQAIKDRAAVRHRGLLHPGIHMVMIIARTGRAAAILWRRAAEHVRPDHPAERRITRCRRRHFVPVLVFS